jgi:hypothetical protein
MSTATMVLYKIHFWQFAVYALLTSSCISYASQKPLQEAEKGEGPFDKDFERLVNETLDHWKCPGLSIAVVDGDDTWAAVSSGFLQFFNSL